MKYGLQCETCERKDPTNTPAYRLAGIASTVPEELLIPDLAESDPKCLPEFVAQVRDFHIAHFGHTLGVFRLNSVDAPVLQEGAR
jgi:hypothetical protein